MQKKQILAAVIATLTIGGFLLTCVNNSTVSGVEVLDKRQRVQAAKQPELLEVASFPTSRPTGIAVSKQGRVFVSLPFSNYSDERHDASVVEVLADGRLNPYPNQLWNTKWENGTDSLSRRFLNVQSLTMDGDGFLWILDTGSPKRTGVVEGGAKLVKVDPNTDEVVQMVTFGKDVVPKVSYLNDVRVDAERQFAYITDSVRGGIIVVNLRSSESRMILEDHPLARDEQRVVPVVEGVELGDKQGKVEFLATDGIALDSEGNYLYYQYRPNSGSKTLYRIATSFLRDKSLSGSELGSKVEEVGTTVVSDGIEIDGSDYVYFTDVERNAISRYRPSGKVEIVMQAQRLKWPDSIAFGANGYMYFTIAQFHLLPGLNNGVDKSVPPFKVYKALIPAPSTQNSTNSKATKFQLELTTTKTSSRRHNTDERID